MNLKNLSFSSSDDFDQIQEFSENSIDRKLKREKIKRYRRFKGHLKTHYVGKLSSFSKLISLSIREKKKQEFTALKIIERRERQGLSDYSKNFVEKINKTKSYSRKYYSENHEQKNISSQIKTNERKIEEKTLKK